MDKAELRMAMKSLMSCPNSVISLRANSEAEAPVAKIRYVCPHSSPGCFRYLLTIAQ